ncbi:hypothetical protein AAFF_G00395280 [Aldrovandia affinis]|uniref:Uncharacterized protein n=1 Tax=Aldrovandia affinis TaxID=143900 RepID=A0AAD7R4E3_9TELE|nr:hypothetical protein AAFF_G00395280 [Aldrovandia affinis]
MYGQKTTHHVNAYEDSGHTPVIQMCRTPAYCARHKDQELLEEPAKQHVCLLEVDNHGDSSPSGGEGKSLRFRAVTEGPTTEFMGLGDAGSLYRNIVERDRDLQQLGITEYLRRNLAQLQQQGGGGGGGGG